MDIYWTQAFPIADMPFGAMISPEKAIKFFPRTIDPEGGMPTSCPATREYFKNVFTMLSPIDYPLDISDTGALSTTHYDQNMFNDVITMRERENRLYSIKFNDIFISEESCLMELTGAHSVMNTFSTNTVVCPGKYDIGKWFRPVEAAFFVDKNVHRLDIKRGDPTAFIKFDTEEQINIKPVYPTPEIQGMLHELMNLKTFTNVTHIVNRSKIINSLQYYYDLLTTNRYKDRLIKLLQENLL